MEIHRVQSLILFLLISIIVNAARSQSLLTKKITIDEQSASAVKFLLLIEKQTGIKAAYGEDVRDNEKKISIRVQQMQLENALKQVLPKYGLTYKLVNNMLVIRKVKSSTRALPPVHAYFQDTLYNIRGKVVDSSGMPLLSATVFIEGTGKGAFTDTSGNFSIKTNDTAGIKLMVSMTGYETVYYVPSLDSFNIIRLRSSNNELNNVIVVGYGTQKKVDLTGAVSVVKGADIAERAGGQTGALLQGMASGVTVVQNSGQPGADGGTIRIRGIGTLNLGADPLVLVDGVEASLNNVDPGEIANISVLKDAASASIYGSRAANGVILVTTKRATANGTSLSFDSYTGWQRPTNTPQIVGAIDHMTMLDEADENSGVTPAYPQDSIDAYKKGTLTNPNLYPNTDWQKLLFSENGLMHHDNVTIMSGNDKVKVLGNLSYLYQNGLTPNTDFKRYNIRINTDININKKLATNIDLFVRRTDMTQPSYGVGALVGQSRTIPANETARYTNGEWGEGWNGSNPIALANDGGISTAQDISAILNLGLKYKPFKWLTAEAYYSPKYDEPHDKSFSNIVQEYQNDLVTPSPFKPISKTALTESFSRDWYNNLRALLTYHQVFWGKHELTVLGGYQQEDEDVADLSAYRDSFPFPQYQVIDAGKVDAALSNGGDETHWALRSYFGRVNYNFDQRYLLEINGRYDGSSRFAPDNRYGFFPSFSAGWRISQEPFMRKLNNVINELKVRASWGQLGNQNISTLYPYLSSISLGSYNYIFGGVFTNGAGLTTLANTGIKWETTNQTDVGLDATFFNKLDITADYYYKKTDGILLNLPIPQIVGLGSPFQNAGVVQNKGWEFNFTYHDHIGEFKYSVSGNLSNVQNKILDLKGVKITGLSSDIEGYPIGAIYGYVAQGYFQDQQEIDNHAKQTGLIGPGDIKYKDLNGDGVIDPNDQAVIGSTIPHYTYSLNISLGWKNIDMSVFGQGVGKADGYIDNQGIMPFYQNGTVQEQHKDHWTADNPNATFPRLTFGQNNNFLPSSFWVKNAAYLRIKNIQVGYTLPTPVLEKIKIRKIRIYASGQNLFTFDSFWKGYDVEAPMGDGGYYPQVKTYTFGVDVTF